MPTADGSPSDVCQGCSPSKVTRGQAQVEDFQHPVLIDQQIRRFDVAVDETGLMGMGQSVGGLADEIGGFTEVQGPLFVNQPSQVRPFDVLHHQVVNIPAVANVLVEVVGPDDVGVVQRGDGPRLDVEPSQQIGVRLILAGQDLDGAAAAHHLVLGQEDFAHPPLAEGPENAIAGRVESRDAFPQQHVRLPAGQDVTLHQFVGQLAGTIGLGPLAAKLLPQRQHQVVWDQTTLTKEIQE